VNVVFYREITIQRAVERDSENRLKHATCAVNPSRIQKTFTDAALREVISNIAVRTGDFCAGPTIRLRWRACCTSNLDHCAELSQGSKD
jgi:hypothetical protein